MFVFSAAGGHPGPDIPQWAGPSQHWEGRREGNPGLEREQTQRHRHPRRSPGRQPTSQRAGPQVSQSHSHSARSNRLLRCRGSTNMDLSRDEEGATQDRSNAPITNTNDPEQVTTQHSPALAPCSHGVSLQISETKCCCFFKRKMRKKKSGRSK